MNKSAVFIAFVVWALPCAAQQVDQEAPTGRRTHLVPVEPAYGLSAVNFDYPKIIATVFREAYAENVRARVYITAGGPGPLQSDMLFLQQIGSDYRLVYLHPLVPLWSYFGKPPTINGRKPPENDPADYHDLKPWRCEKSLSAQLGGRVVELWKRVLLETRYNMKKERGLDGGDYMFSMEVDYEDAYSRQELAGTIWSPDENTKPGMLVGIVGALSAQCVPELYGDPEPLEPFIEKLEKTFAASTAHDNAVSPPKSQ